MKPASIEDLAQLMIYLAGVVAWKTAGGGQEGLQIFHEVKILGQEKWLEMLDERKTA